MSVATHILTDLPLFRNIKHQDLEQIAVLMTQLKVSEGEVIMRQGALANTFYVILSGNYMIEFAEGRSLTLHQPGDIMGWSTMVAPYHYTGTGIALTDGELLSMPGQELNQLIRSNTALADEFMQRINRVVNERMVLVKNGGGKPGPQ